MSEIRSRKVYTKEFKKETVLLVLERGMTVSQVSEDLEIDSCEVLYRPNSTTPFVRVANLANTVETVAHFKIINGLTQFGEFAVTGKGGIVSTPKQKEIIPETYSLEQNYPNPFNPSTTIKFSLPNRAKVNLRVFNNRGELVTELVNGELTAGYHSVVFNSRSAQLSSGIYYYQLRAESSEGSFARTRKLVLLK